MVKAKANLTGNCRRLISKGNPESDDIKLILVMKTLSPLFLPLIISASITFLKKFVQISLDPLHNPGTPDGSSVFKNSIGYKTLDLYYRLNQHLNILDFRLEIC